MEVIVPPALAVPAITQLQLLRQGLAQRPESSALRMRLAARLFDRDQFDEAAAVLGEPSDSAAPREHLLWSQILLSRGGAGDAEAAEGHAARAATGAETEADRQQAMLTRARALLRLGREGEGLDLLQAILAADPDHHGAFRTLTDTLLRTGDGAGVLALITQLEHAGARHPRRLGARMLAEARSGRSDTARALSGIELLATSTLALPAGWSSLAAFNAALRLEAEQDPDLRAGRHGTSSRGTIRVDHPQRAGAMAFAALHRQIAEAVERRIATLDSIGHPWIAARPARLVMRSWCVMTDGEGYEEWHNHPAGWMSGGYYIAVPDTGHDDTCQAACLALGLPPALTGNVAAAEFGETFVRPFPGMLALFPSHAYHHTYPHRQQERRICMAFDLEPG